MLVFEAIRKGLTLRNLIIDSEEFFPGALIVSFCSFPQAAAAAQAGASVIQIFVGRVRVKSSADFWSHRCIKGSDHEKKNWNRIGPALTLAILRLRPH